MKFDDLDNSIKERKWPWHVEMIIRIFVMSWACFYCAKHWVLGNYIAFGVWLIPALMFSFLITSLLLIGVKDET